MSKITRKLPNPEGVVAGGTATFRIPVGRRLHALYLDYAYNVTTQNVADFEEIRIFANGQVIQRFTGTERDVLNQFEGVAASVGVLILPFDRNELKTVAGQEETAINTGVTDAQGRMITSMYMEIDLNSGMTIAASDLALYSKESDAIAGGPGTIPYIRREQRNPSGADTDFQISDLVNPGVNAPDKIALNRITFVPSTGSISNLKIDRNGYSIFDRSDELNRVIQNAGQRAAVAAYYMIDSTENGYGGEPIDLFGMTDYRYRLNVSAAMTLTCISEYLGVLNG
jgi:hypothetical protein